MPRNSAKTRQVLFGAVAIAALGGFAGAATAQETKIEVQAVAGMPLGVGRITVRFAAGAEPRLARGQSVWISDQEGRVLYPAFDKLTMRRQLGFESTTPLQSVGAYFLFRGDRPLDLTFDIVDRHSARVVPLKDMKAHKPLLDDWWATHVSMVESLAEANTCPLQVENYVSSMLARRLKLKPAETMHRWSGHSDIDMIFGSLLGAESIRLAMQKDALLNSSDAAEKANLPLPRPVAPPAVEIPNVPGDVAIEPVAKHVPAECFYLRCGTISNLQWLRAKGEIWGGRLRDLMELRGLDHEICERVERQLAIRENVSARLFGDVVIDDMAIIGTDMFLREGPAIGVLFHAAKGRALSAAIGLQRQDAIRAARSTPDLMVRERSVEIAGRKVSFLESADNSVRSFYAVDGDFHLVTTSQTIARRFFEAGAGKDSLADLQEFRYARSLMPLARDDTLFLYLSDPWFRQLVGPQYRVEMTRRMQAEAEIELVHLARLAAKAEQQPSETIDQLVAGGFLPEGFDRHPEGSRLIVKGAEIVDSRRGARRSLLPIPDVEIAGITETENTSYEEFSQMYIRLWQRVDPVIIGIKREEQQTPAGRREKVVLDVHITPYARQHYSIFADILAAPDKQRLVPIPGNLFEAEARAGFPFFAAGERKSVRLFAGLRDFKMPFAFEQGHVIPNVSIIEKGEPPVYVGNTAGMPLLRFGDMEAVPDGYSESLKGGLLRWARKFDDFLVEAGQRAILEAVTPQLKFEEANRHAQLRLRVADLAQSQFAEILHAGGYERARATSAANVFFLHALMQQLCVDPEKSLETMQAVLAAHPVCPLGGDYHLNKTGPGHVRWNSTGWAQEYVGNENSVPPNYKFPFLEWFRGLDLEFSIDATTLTTHIEFLLAP